MKLNELIGNTLKELEEAKKHEAKKRYLIDEVELELSVQSVTTASGGVELQIFNVGPSANAGLERQNAHKITIKLKPKKGGNA